MSDNVDITPGTGATISTDDIGGGTQAQNVKLLDGTSGSSTPIPGGANGLKVDPSSVTSPVSDAGGSLTVDAPVGTPVFVRLSDGTSAIVTLPISAATLPLPTGAATLAKQPALGTAGSASVDVISIQGIASMTPIKTDGSGVTQPVSDAGGSFTVDAPAGTPVFVRLSDGTSALSTLPVSIASLPLPTGASTAAKQPALGTAGSSSTDVLTVQGIASGTGLPVSAAALPLPSGAATAAKQPALGTAGSAASDVITVQGIASGTAQPASQSGTWTIQPGNTANTTAWKVDGSAVTQPVSGTVTANISPTNITKHVCDAGTLTAGTLKTASLTVSGFTAAELEFTNVSGAAAIGITLDGTTPAVTAITVADGVTNSTATVTSATAAFSSARDVGRPITGTDIPANTYVGVVNSGTSIGLSSSSSSNVPVNATGTHSGNTLTMPVNFVALLPATPCSEILAVNATPTLKILSAGTPTWAAVVRG